MLCRDEVEGDISPHCFTPFLVDGARACDVLNRVSEGRSHDGPIAGCHENSSGCLRSISGGRSKISGMGKVNCILDQPSLSECGFTCDSENVGGLTGSLQPTKISRLSFKPLHVTSLVIAPSKRPRALEIF